MKASKVPEDYYKEKFSVKGASDLWNNINRIFL